MSRVSLRCAGYAATPAREEARKRRGATEDGKQGYIQA